MKNFFGERVGVLQVLPVILLLVGLPIAVWLDLDNLADTNLHHQARDLSSMISSVRAYYATNVVDRVLERREISVSARVRGGAERTRTACQARSRYRTGLSRVIRRGNSAIKCRRSRATTLSRKDWHSGAIGAVLSVNFGRQGRPEILPRRLHRRGGASVVRRDAAKPNGGSQCQSLQRSDRRRQRQPPFQRQNHRDTVLAILSRRGPIAARSNRASSPCCNHPRAQRSKR